MILLKQAKIYLRLLSNFRKVSKIRSPYFFIFTMPLFGFFVYLFGSLLLLFNYKKLIVFFFEKKIFLSSIRFFDIESLRKVSQVLPRYNQINEKLKSECVINNISGEEILNNVKTNGYASLGKVFTNEECTNLIQYLENKSCYNSQTPMQSTGVKINFKSENVINSNNSSAYYAFDPNIIYHYKPLKNFLENKNLNDLIDNYLNFKSSIYNSATWFNPPTKERHYVYRLHKDHDDFKFIGLVIYWTKTDISSGATRIVEKSHIKNNQTSEKYLEGSAGTIYLADFSALHAGTKVENNPRVTTFLRYGKSFNHCTVVDCWAGTPQV